MSDYNETCDCADCESMNAFKKAFNDQQDWWPKRIDVLTKALIRARDQLALYKADYSVAQCNKALETDAV